MVQTEEAGEPYLTDLDHAAWRRRDSASTCNVASARVRRNTRDAAVPAVGFEPTRAFARRLAESLPGAIHSTHVVSRERGDGSG